MNKIEVIKNLERCFVGFRVHENLIGELANIIQNSGDAPQFLKKLATNLKILKKFREKAHLKLPKVFEELKHAEKLYSMRFKMKNLNVRIIYTFESDGTILLHGFYEREGKSKTDYDKAIPVAQQRKEEMSE